MNDDRLPATESGDVDQVAGEHGEPIGDAVAGDDAAESSGGAVPISEPAASHTLRADSRTQSRITVAALVVFAAAVVLLVVSVIQHG